MPKFTLIVIGLAAVLVVAVTLVARLLLAPVSNSPLQVVSGDTTPLTIVQQYPALEDVRQSVQLRLDSEWQVTTITAAELEKVVTTFDPSRAQTYQRAASILLAGRAHDATLISAAHRSGATLQVSALKRNGLSMDAYLAGVGEQLSAAGATIHSNGIDATLRADRLPAAQLQYTWVERAADGQMTATAGVQVATFDASAARLVVFTLTGEQAQHNELAQLMSTILAAAAF